MRLGLHFSWREGVAAAAADSENMMSFKGLTAGRHSIVRGLLAAGLLLLAAKAALPAEEFPFDQELILDTAPMPPAKRVPVLTVEPNGNATIDLWCKTVRARVEFSDAAIKIEPAPLPDGTAAIHEPRSMHAGAHQRRCIDAVGAGAGDRLAQGGQCRGAQRADNDEVAAIEPLGILARPGNRPGMLGWVAAACGLTKIAMTSGWAS